MKVAMEMILHGNNISYQGVITTDTPTNNFCTMNQGISYKWKY